MTTVINSLVHNGTHWNVAPIIKNDGGSSSSVAPSQSSISSYLTNLVTNSSLSSTLSSYVLSSALSAYETTSALSTTLSSYVTNSSLSTTLGSYVTSSSLSTTLSSYALSSALSVYETTSALATTLSNYVTNSSLTSTLSSYVTNSSLTTTLSSYFLKSKVDTDLTNSVDTEVPSVKAINTALSGTLSPAGLTMGGQNVTSIKTVLTDNSNSYLATQGAIYSFIQAPIYSYGTISLGSGSGPFYDVSIDTSHFLYRISNASNTGSHIGGFSGGSNGRVVFVTWCYSGSAGSTINLDNLNSNETNKNNRINIPANGGVTLVAGATGLTSSFMLVYDGNCWNGTDATGCWILFGNFP